MGELQEKELESILSLKPSDFEEFKLPTNLYNTACKDCEFKNNGYCSGFCVKKFISDSL